MNATNNQPWLDVPVTGPILRPTEAAVYIGVSVSTFYEMVKEGSAPPVAKIGARAAGVPRPWLDAMLAARVNGGRK